MNSTSWRVAGVGLLIGVLLSLQTAHGGRFGGGGGARGGGGGARGGGPISRPSAGARGGGYEHASFHQAGAVHGPYGGGFEGGRQGATAVGNRGGFAEGGRSAGAYAGPRGVEAFGGARHGEFTGPGGNTFGGGRAGGVVIGPNGNVHAGGIQGGAVVTPSGVAAAGRRGEFSAGPNGFVGGGSRGGFANGPNGFVGGLGRGSAAFGPYSAAALGSRSFAGYGRAGGGFVGTRYVSGAALRNQGAYIRRGFGYTNAFSPGWYGRYPGAWLAAGWGLGMAWNSLPWGGYSNYLGYAPGIQPVDFDYGNTVTYQQGQVYYGDQPIASAADYAQQAAQIAAVGQQQANLAAADASWQPLGVFAMAQGDETSSNDIFQLALNPAGLVRGNYYNAFTDSNQPISGSLDKTSQRLAWTIGDRPNPVYETGLYNLTQEQTTLLVHFGPDRTDQYRLFRIPQPGEPGANPNPNPNPILDPNTPPQPEPFPQPVPGP